MKENNNDMLDQDYDGGDSGVISFYDDDVNDDDQSGWSVIMTLDHVSSRTSPDILRNTRNIEGSL